MVTGQHPQRLLISLPRLATDPLQLPVELVNGERCPITVVHFKLEELRKEIKSRVKNGMDSWWIRRCFLPSIMQDAGPIKPQGSQAQVCMQISTLIICPIINCYLRETYELWFENRPSIRPLIHLVAYYVLSIMGLQVSSLISMRFGVIQGLPGSCELRWYRWWVSGQGVAAKRNHALVPEVDTKQRGENTGPCREGNHVNIQPTGFGWHEERTHKQVNDLQVSIHHLSGCQF